MSSVLNPALVVNVLLEEGANAPSYESHGAAGFDLSAFEDCELAPMERRAVRTGLRVEIPHGYEGQVRGRSGLALKHGIGLVNAPGTIDSDYRGEIRVILINWGSEAFMIRQGDRIAQMVIAPVHQAALRVVTELVETERGEGGFGSTGK